MNVLAAVAHPDDIEFMMAGTLLLLKEAGATIHLWNLANGSCGTEVETREAIVRIRREEAAASARLAGGVDHDPLFDDLAVFYDAPSLARVAAVVREIAPEIIITHSPHDYMEDHEAVCRLVTSSAFSRGMKHFPSDPVRTGYSKPVRLYHALPHGLRDGLGRLQQPDFYVNIAGTIGLKRDMLACHRSQKAWLDASQGMDAYLEEMENLSRAMGAMSGRFEVAEGFIRHNHLGFCPADYDPLADLLAPHVAPAPATRA